MSKLLTRLTSQIKGEGRPPAVARKIAGGQLERFGEAKDGKLTAKGKEREAMGAAGRAKDRSAKYSGGKPEDYTYNPRTNYARRK